MNLNFSILLKTLPFLIIIILAKILIVYFSLEAFAISGILSGIISANVFLIGFLLAGVFADYREAEKLPNEISSSFDALIDDVDILRTKNKNDLAERYLIQLRDLSEDIYSWFHKKVRTYKILEDIGLIAKTINEQEGILQPNFIVRLKQEQNNIRKCLKRIDSIRDQSFLGTGYTIVFVINIVTIITLLFLRFEDVYEGVFLITILSLILIYMQILIRYLDNPFAYYDKANVTENVSIEPILHITERIKKELEIKKSL